MTTSERHQPTPLWAGGFSEPTHPALVALSGSLADDLPLADADLEASAVYARALAKAGVLSAAEGEQLAAALMAMRKDLASGRWVPDATAEDIHTAIEAEVVRRTGEVGERLHTGRSRNDQVATAFRLALARRTSAVLAEVRKLQAEIVRRAAEEIDTLAPAYTHLQRAQPVLLAHWLLAHFWPLERDAERLTEARRRTLKLPLGSGALSGHPFGIDRAWMARELGCAAPTENSLDAVGDRDFAVETVSALTLLATHLSRLAEELVLWSTSEFGFVRWPDALATGSSLMPNKKNPDLCELVRGRAAMALGDLVALVALLKGLPVSYQRDLQESKPPAWRATAQAQESLVAMTAAMAGVSFDRQRLAAAVSDDMLATEAADLLVARGMPFRKAHGVVAQAAAAARRRGTGLSQLSGADLPAPLTAADLAGLNAAQAIQRRTASGGTARSAVEEQLVQARAALAAATKGEAS